MTTDSELRREARAVADERLWRSRALLARLTPDEREAVEDVAHAIAARVAESLVVLPPRPSSAGSEEMVAAGSPALAQYTATGQAR
jgi:hypothetical protein